MATLNASAHPCDSGEVRQWKESSPGSIFLNLINFSFQMRGKAFKHLAAWAVLATGLVMSSVCSKTEPDAVAP